MQETVEFSNPDLAKDLFGPYNANLAILAEVSGAEIDSCGSSAIISHQRQEVCLTVCKVLLQIHDLLRSGTPIASQDYSRAYQMLMEDQGLELAKIFKEAVFVSTPRKNVTARTVSQKKYLAAMQENELVFAIGPAGTGKTYLAVAMGLNFFLQHRVKRIVLTRPAVEAGERLGFLPGDLAEKVNPYLRPLYDALHDMLPQAKVAAMLENGQIEIAPLAFMRGRTLTNAFVILDEAQNTTCEQMKMFLTRMGFGSRMVITGDPSQIDLPFQAGRSPSSGLTHALGILHRPINGLAIHHFGQADVIRHPLVGAIVKAYDNAEKEKSTI